MNSREKKSVYSETYDLIRINYVFYKISIWNYESPSARLGSFTVFKGNTSSKLSTVVIFDETSILAAKTVNNLSLEPHLKDQKIRKVKQVKFGCLLNEYKDSSTLLATIW